MTPDVEWRLWVRGLLPKHRPTRGEQFLALREKLEQEQHAASVHTALAALVESRR